MSVSSGDHIGDTDADDTRTVDTDTDGVDNVGDISSGDNDDQK